MSKYPTDYYDDAWGRMHEGHGLDADMLLADLTHSQSKSPESVMRVRELHLSEIPRVKWCERYDVPCEFNGEWHRHWLGVKPGADAAKFTLASWHRPRFT